MVRVRCFGGDVVSFLIPTYPVLILIALVVFIIHRGEKNLPAPIVFTAICPNCDLEIYFTDQNAPNATIRLRDHLKECVS